MNKGKLEINNMRFQKRGDHLRFHPIVKVLYQGKLYPVKHIWESDLYLNI